MMLRLEKWKEASKNRGVENVLEEDFMRIIQIEKRVHLLEFITIQLRSISSLYSPSRKWQQN